jgi:hypothetical protein
MGRAIDKGDRLFELDHVAMSQPGNGGALRDSKSACRPPVSAFSFVVAVRRSRMAAGHSAS